MTACFSRYGRCLPALCLPFLCCSPVQQLETVAAGKQHLAADKRPLEITFSVTHAKDVTKPLLSVTYYNAGAVPVEIVLPGQTNRVRGKTVFSDLQSFREIDIQVDRQPPKFVRKVVSGRLLRVSRREKLKPGERAILRVPLDAICRLPKDWRDISLKTSQIFGVEAKFVGNLTIHHVRHTFLDPIHITAAPVLPMNYDDPRISVRFRNVGKKMFQLPLPKAGTETKMFWSLVAWIDRKKVRSFGEHSPLEGYKALTRFVPLEPGESTEITIRLKDYFKIPKDWKRIEIDADRFSLPKKGEQRFMNPEYQDTLTLTRPLKRPINVPPAVWRRSDDLVRWFLYHQQQQLEKLKAKPAKMK